MFIRTNAQIGAWKCNFLGNYDRQTQTADRPTDRPNNRQSHRRVSLPIMNNLCGLNHGRPPNFRFKENFYHFNTNKKGC